LDLESRDDGYHRCIIAHRPAAAQDGIRGARLASADLVAGNIGAGDRVTYTIVGDAVNQAERLQAMTNDLAASILLTASTRIALGDGHDIPLTPCGPVALKGIDVPVEVYAVANATDIAVGASLRGHSSRGT
jgi:class 3 adenylate cyclase